MSKNIEIFSVLKIREQVYQLLQQAKQINNQIAIASIKESLSKLDFECDRLLERTEYKLIDDRSFSSKGVPIPKTMLKDCLDDALPGDEFLVFSCLSDNRVFLYHVKEEIDTLNRDTVLSIDSSFKLMLPIRFVPKGKHCTKVYFCKKTQTFMFDFQNN